MSFLDYDPHVIPLLPNSKQPAKKFAGVDFDLNEVFNGAKNGRNNVALLAQPNFVFIDIDTKEGHNSDGISHFMKWCKKKKIDCEKLFESTLVQKTPTGSIHLIFRKNPRYEIKQIIKLLDGVDIKGSDNNFIVIAPSTVDGKKYAFDDPSKDPVVIPDDLACAIVSEHERVKRSNRRAIKNGGLTSDGLKYNQAFTKNPVLDVFYTIRNGFGAVGSRNINIFKWAQAMRIITDKETAIEYGKTANHNSNEPVNENELIATIESAYNFVKPVEPFNVNGADWVRIDDKRAVLEKVFYAHKGSFEIEDYDETDIYLFNANARFTGGGKQTVFNYRKDEDK